MMKIYRIAQFGRAEEFAQMEYDRAMNSTMINNIKIAILSLFKGSPTIDKIKIEVLAKKDNEGTIGLLVNIDSPNSQKILDVLNSKEMLDKIKSVSGIYPEINVNIIPDIIVPTTPKFDWNKVDWNKTNKEISFETGFGLSWVSRKREQYKKIKEYDSIFNPIETSLNSWYRMAKKKQSFKEKDATLTPKEREELKSLFGEDVQCSFAKDEDGYYCYTHRARSNSYPSIDKIPKSKVEFIGSTG